MVVYPEANETFTWRKRGLLGLMLELTESGVYSRRTSWALELNLQHRREIEVQYDNRVRFPAPNKMEYTTTAASLFFSHHKTDIPRMMSEAQIRRLECSYVDEWDDVSEERDATLRAVTMSNQPVSVDKCWDGYPLELDAITPMNRSNAESVLNALKKPNKSWWGHVQRTVWAVAYLRKHIKNGKSGKWTLVPEEDDYKFAMDRIQRYEEGDEWMRRKRKKSKSEDELSEPLWHDMVEQAIKNRQQIRVSELAKCCDVTRQTMTKYLKKIGHDIVPKKGRGGLEHWLF
jgi:hypothetical protein